jgi:hypothetical protein
MFAISNGGPLCFDASAKSLRASISREKRAPLYES